MRKFFIIISAFCLRLPLTAAWAEGNGTLNFKIFPGGSLQTILDRAKGYIFAFGLIAAVIMILWAGIEFITSGGEMKKVTSAKNRIKNTLIGVVVMILAEGIILVLQSILVP